MGIIKEFKTFAQKGNVVDMAVGIIVGVAFGKIVTSFVSDIVMPPIGLLVGGINFTNLNIVIKTATDTSPAVTINYGNFIQVVFDFLIVAIVVFMAIKAMNSAKRKKEIAPSAPPAPTKQEELLAEIRDLLKK
jgi:large conductance mechanosensitive channel